MQYLRVATKCCITFITANRLWRVSDIEDPLPRPPLPMSSLATRLSLSRVEAVATNGDIYASQRSGIAFWRALSFTHTLCWLLFPKFVLSNSWAWTPLISHTCSGRLAGTKHPIQSGVKRYVSFPRLDWWPHGLILCDNSTDADSHASLPDQSLWHQWFSLPPFFTSRSAKSVSPISSVSSCYKWASASQQNGGKCIRRKSKFWFLLYPTSSIFTFVME